MGSNETPKDSEELPADPAELLPDGNVLSLDEYLEMYAAVGHRTRYEIIHRLVHGGQQTASELRKAIEVDDSTLYYHLNELDDVGLIEKRCRTDRGQNALETYYQATIFGNAVLTSGVNELICGEQDFEAIYDSSTD